MKEVEAKIMIGCSRYDEVKRKLENIAVREGVVVEEDTYLQHPCRNFAETDEALRIRRTSNGIVEVTYKGPKRLIDGVKVRVETTIRVSEGDVDTLLVELGFKPVAKIRKERIYYRLDDPRVKISLDRVEELGCFVEIEAVDGNPETVRRAIHLLGLEGYEKVEKSYLELYLERRGVVEQTGKKR